MTEESKDRPKIFTIIVTGVVSLVVGVASALLINYFTEKRLELTYDITSAEVFEDQNQKIGILAIQISNTGRKEIEDVHCRILLNKATLVKYRSKGIPPTSITVSNNTSELNAKTPYLNPNEAFSLQLLVQPEESTLKEPIIEIRGKGITASRKSLEDVWTKKKVSATAFLTPIATILAASLTLFIIRRKRGALFSGGEQRDEFAYLLSANGFIAEASILRESSRNHSYWSLSDYFTEQLLSKSPNDKEALSRAVHVLEQLLAYSENMAPSSKAIVNLNAAYLAQIAGDEVKATDLLREARKCHASVVSQRMKLDNRLKFSTQS
jgi:hypothetical protein